MIDPRLRCGPGNGNPLAVAIRLLPLVAVLVVPGSARAAQGDYDTKAAFLLNFARLVRWPPQALPGPAQPLVIAVKGSDEVVQALARGVADARVGDRAVAVRRIASAEELSGAQMLFVSGEAPAAANAWIDAARARSVLLVGESEGFARRGGEINFFREGGRLRFEINLEAAHRAGLQISSRLLRLAVLVTDEG